MRRPVRRRRAPLLLAGLAVFGSLTSCAVPPSDVIQAGPAATGMPPDTVLYFLSAADGSLVPSARSTDGPADVTTALRLLFAGPQTGETPQLTTQLPRLPAPPAVATSAGDVNVRIPDGVDPFTEPALRQLACTAAAALRTSPDSAAPAPAPVPNSPATDGPLASPSSPSAEAERVRHITVRVSGEGWTASRAADSCPTA